ncbi:MAG: signal peptidase I [Vicinamibacterales bacterium]
MPAVPGPVLELVAPLQPAAAPAGTGAVATVLAAVPGALTVPGDRHAGEDAPAGTGATGVEATAAPPEPAAPPAGTDEPDDEAPRPWTQFTLEWIGIVAGALLVALVIKLVLLQAFVIPSPSMEPTLDISDRVLVLKPAYRLHGIDRGDVIVFDRPEELRVNGETSDLIKRVIGLPGETVDAVGGQVRVNGVPLEEPWLPDGVLTNDFGPVAVPEGTVWVMGDNRGQSSDSRRFGVLDQDHIVGEAIVRWWPLSRFGGL